MTGSLLSHDALSLVVPTALQGLLGEHGRESAREHMRRWHFPLRAELGPATSARACFDRLAAPLFAQLGYRVLASGGGPAHVGAVLETSGGPSAVALVTGWGQDPGSVWRECVRHGIAHGVRWCLCVTGPLLRVVDSRRTYSRQFVEFEIDAACDHADTFAVFWGLLRGESMRRHDGRSLLERAIELSEGHRTDVRNALQHGVHEALLHLVQAFRTAARRGGAPGLRRDRRMFDESLIVIYRILFLLFAEARGMVPRWHPIYRDAYTIEALREAVENLSRPPGLWETLQAIARLAHRGCRLGALRVPPFNGRLFSPAQSPLADSLRLDDGGVRRAMLALTTREGRGGRQRIAYGDLGVEHLGAVYERLLDFDVQLPPGRSASLVRSEKRKATGSFYTPRPLTEYLVRRTLAPLVHDASPEQILALRVVDPAMGSGAFLVAACRYLSSAYEAALIREGTVSPTDIEDRERAGFRRTVAQRCVYGVDNNPMAVQLARLSLWLATLAGDRPLTFLDHRMRTGKSLLGASLIDLARQRPAGTNRSRSTRPLPLFPEDHLEEAIRQTVDIRTAIAVEPGDTLEQVRSKERALASLGAADAALSRWRAVASLWCAGWFGAPAQRRARCAAFGALADALLGRPPGLPDRVATPMLDEAREIARELNFFHWTLEFPEAFFAAAGSTSESAGFDAVIGNPPWEMLRGDRGPDDLRCSTRAAAGQLTDFARGSGIYRLQGDGHPNLYQLFLDRSLSLLRSGGRLGFLLPAGLATDRGSARLRQALLDRTEIDSCVSIENRDGIFPIHRGVRFMAVTLSKAGRSTALPCRFGVRRVDVLDSLPDTGRDPGALALPRPLLERIGGRDLVIPDVRTSIDLDILSHVAFTFPALGDSVWNVRFGRELNATDDRRHFVPAGQGLPVLEGKQIAPFRADTAAARFGIPQHVASRLLDPARTFRRPRLAYRDVAASTNQLTLIAAIVPADIVTTHTLFCLKPALDERTQYYLCGIFNSFVANYLVRLRVITHVSAGIIEHLPVPRPSESDPRFQEVALLSEALASDPADRPSYIRLQALAAELYQLRRDQFRRVLETFPLVPQAERAAAFAAFAV